jgi:hypothetical protein
VEYVARPGRPAAAEEVDSMSHRGVEVVLGRLATDEALREKFLAAARRTLEELIAQGLELSGVERAALEGLDRAALDQFAAALDPRLQKALLGPLHGAEDGTGGAQ